MDLNQVKESLHILLAFIVCYAFKTSVVSIKFAQIKVNLPFIYLIRIKITGPYPYYTKKKKKKLKSQVIKLKNHFKSHQLN